MSQLTHPAETHSGVVTSWLPITTAYASTTQCSSTLLRHIDYNDGPELYAFDINLAFNVNSFLRCLPQEATAWWNQESLGLSGTTTLLGPITCPEAYTTATTSVVDDYTTFVACCPSDYHFISVDDAGNPGECSSQIPAGQVFTYASETEKHAYSMVTTSSTAATEAYGLQINGYIFASSSTTAGSTATGSDTTTSIATSSATSAPTSSNVSAGAVAGIAIGAAAAGCLLSFLIVWFMMRHRKNQQQEKSMMVYGDGTDGTGTVPLGELENPFLHHELPGSGTAHELTGHKVMGT